MADLIVHNINDDTANALKVRASQHDISVEKEHRRILEQALMKPGKKNYIEVLSQMPSVGEDSDSARIQQ